MLDKGAKAGLMSPLTWPPLHGHRSRGLSPFRETCNSPSSLRPFFAQDVNKTLLIHGAWLIVAISSFVVGALLFPVGHGSSAGGEAPMASVVSTKGEEGLVGTDSVLGSPGKAVLGPGKGKIGGSVASLSHRDIASLGEELRRATSPIDRRLVFSRLLEGLTAENALAIREQIAHLHHHSAEFREFHYAWGALSGTEAIMFGATTEEDDMSPALAGWASADPSAAIAWFEGLDMEKDAGFDPLIKDRKIPADDLRGHLMRGLVQGLADADPNRASDFVLAMVRAGHRGAEHMMHGVAEAVLRAGAPADAAAWAEQLPAGPGRNIAMHRVADRYVDADPIAAAAWAEKFSHRPESAGVIAEVAANWSHEDLQAALDWLTDLPEGSGQSAGLRRTLHDWAHRNPTEASKYLTTMPASDAKDAAISGFSRRVAWEDPEAAITWAQTISSEDERNGTMIGVGRAWARRDATAAAEWAASSGLPEDVQRAIFNPPRDGDRR